MDYKAELNNLVDIVKRNGVNSGRKITKEQIAARLGMHRTRLSVLLNGNEEVKKKHIDQFKYEFQQELGEVNGKPAAGDPLNPERAILLALLEDYVEWKAEETGATFEDVKAALIQRGKRKLDGLDSWLPS